MIDVLDPGLQTTIQDGGRPGHLAKGIPPAGPQDHYSMLMGSLLVGNALPPPPLTPGDPGDAGLEVLLKGLKLRFGGEAVIAITGAEMLAQLDGEPIPLWQSVPVSSGMLLDMGIAARGARGYLAISGGIDVPPYLGSRATYVRGKQGGLDGRALRKGDTLPLRSPRRPLAEVMHRRIHDDLLPQISPPWTLRVVRGPQEHLFTSESVEVFYATEWKLSPVADRMGFRFVGPPLSFHERPAYLVRDAGSGPSDIVEDVSPLGGIQVASGIEPIILGVEVPSVGGYARIATLISADLGRLGQMRPGEPARFLAVDVEEAVEIGVEQVRRASDAATVVLA